MEFVAQTAFLAIVTFAVVAGIVLLASAFLSEPSEGHLQPRFGSRAQGWVIIICVFAAPAIHRIFVRRLNDQEQINSISVSTSVLLLVWVFLISRRLANRTDSNANENAK